MKRILFVDDDPAELTKYRQIESHLAGSWEFLYVQNAAAALEILNQMPVDAVVTDQGMPEIDGAQLLEIVRTRCPLTVRILVSGTFDWQTSSRLFNTSHRYLNKPLDAEAVLETLCRALYLRDLLKSNHLQSLVSQTNALPSLPGIYLALVKELDRPDPSMENIAEVITRDMSMCSQMLRLVNSPFFGLAFPIENPADAVNYLGVETIKVMVLSLQIFSMFGRVRLDEFPYHELWEHSWEVGNLAQRISMSQRVSREMASEACMGGVLHDVGKLMLATGVPNDYRQVLRLEKEGVATLEAEQKILGCTHAELGAYLLGLWGLPDPIVEAVALHHRPTNAASKGYSPVTAVHVADALVRESGDPEIPRLNETYLEAAGLSDQVDVWREQYDPVEALG